MSPIFPGKMNRYHWGFYDAAHTTGTEEEQVAVCRRVRDEIRRVFEAYAALLLDARGRWVKNSINHEPNMSIWTSDAYGWKNFAVIIAIVANHCCYAVNCTRIGRKT